MKLTQAILPVAGLGTRFLPWTKVVPKELLPIGNVPIIALLVDEALSVGIREMCFVISEGKEAIPQYFKEHPELEKELAKRGKSHMLEDLSKYSEVKFDVVMQREMKGDGHAILQAASWIKTPVTAVLFGDDLIEGSKTGLQQLASAYESLEPGSALLAVENVPRDLVSKYGIIDVDVAGSFGSGSSIRGERLKKIKGLVEKPKPADAPSTFGIVGKYLIPRSTFDALPKVGASHGGEIRLIDALMAQLKEIPIYAYEFEGKRYDTGTPEGYKEAVKELG